MVRVRKHRASLMYNNGRFDIVIHPAKIRDSGRSVKYSDIKKVMQEESLPTYVRMEGHRVLLVAYPDRYFKMDKVIERSSYVIDKDTGISNITKYVNVPGYRVLYLSIECTHPHISIVRITEKLIRYLQKRQHRYDYVRLYISHYWNIRIRVNITIRDIPPLPRLLKCYISQRMKSMRDPASPHLRIWVPVDDYYLRDYEQRDESEQPIYLHTNQISSFRAKTREGLLQQIARYRDNIFSGRLLKIKKYTDIICFH